MVERHSLASFYHRERVVDSSLFPDCALGLPTVGCAVDAPTQIQREPRPASTVARSVGHR